jgi:hypothetical protein
MFCIVAKNGREVLMGWCGGGGGGGGGEVVGL